MATEQEKDDEMSTKKDKDKRKLRVVNSKEPAPTQPLLDSATKKQILIGVLTTTAVVGGMKLIEWAYASYTSKDQKPAPSKNAVAPNPMLPGATTPAMFQSPYNQMMRPLPAPMQPTLMQGVEMQQPNPMTAAPETSDEEPKWFAKYAEMMDTRMAKLEKKRSKPLRKKVEDYDEG